MCIDWGVPGRTCEILSVFVGYVLTVWILVTFGETEVNDIYLIFRLLCSTNQEIVWFDITVNDSLFMNFFDSLHHLYGNKKNCLKVETPFTRLEQIL